MSQFGSDKEQVDVTKVTDKLKANWSTVCVECQFVWTSVSFIYFYSNFLTVHVALHVN